MPKEKSFNNELEPSEENGPISESPDFILGKKIGIILEDEGLKRVLKYFISNNNQPSYHNEIFNIVKGSKTTVSVALHRLVDEFKFLESKYEQIPKNNRMISVLMFNVVDYYFNIFKNMPEFL